MYSCVTTNGCLTSVAHKAAVIPAPIYKCGLLAALMDGADTERAVCSDRSQESGGSGHVPVNWWQTASPPL